MGKSVFGNTKFRKRMNLAPGVSANFGKTGGSVSVGPRGCKTTFGKNGVRATVGMPGTGFSASAYRPYHSKRKSSTTILDGKTFIVRSRKSNMAWGFTLLALSVAAAVFSFTYPHLMEIGRWTISIVVGGFLLIGSIVFFTAKCQEDYQEEINGLDDKLNSLEEAFNETKESIMSQKITQPSSSDIDELLRILYGKGQEYYKADISCIRDRDNIRLKEKAHSIREELQAQMMELDNVVHLMAPRQREYYNTIRPEESSNVFIRNTEQ